MKYLDVVFGQFKHVPNYTFIVSAVRRIIFQSQTINPTFLVQVQQHLHKQPRLEQTHQTATEIRAEILRKGKDNTRCQKATEPIDVIQG